MTLPFSVDPLLLASGGYTINRSVRLRSAASAYLGRTFGTPTNNTKWTYSTWFKRGNFTNSQNICITNGTDNQQLYFNNGVDNLIWLNGAAGTVFATNQVFRDPSAWYHIVLSVDSAASGTNKVLLYINGTQVTSFSTDARSSFASTSINTAVVQNLFRSLLYSNYFDGYAAETYFVDGQQLTPSSFGFTDNNGIWQLKSYTGTYGNNGFYLKFTDNSAATATTLGKDYSGNGNNWTPNNISVTAGVTYDSMLDSPTNDAGASNYAVLNPLTGSNQSVWALTNANLTYALGNSTTWASARSNVLITSGKWYWEITPANTQNCLMGICLETVPFQTSPAQSGVIGYNNDGSKSVNGTTTAYATAWAAGNIIGVAFDATAGTLTVYKNNTSLGTLASGITGSLGYFPCWFGGNNNAQGDVNFGQRPFSYTPPSGFVALNTYNLPVATINNGATVMAASTYTGTGATQSIVNSGNNAAATSFKPDLVWIKGRNVVSNNVLIDSVRGASVLLSSDQTAAESSATALFSSINSNGFTVTGTSAATNQSGETLIGWQWQAGQGTTSSNTNGSITSTVSVNASAGFSVVTYTGTGANATVGHGLGVQPKMVIIKDRNDVTNWAVNHVSIWSAGTGVLYLNLTNASSADATFWNSTNPTTSVIYLGTNASVNGSGKQNVAYCWSEVAGYSKFGSYTGNGSTDGPFIYCGFRPRFIMTKDSTSGVTNWIIQDTSRDPYNLSATTLAPNSTAAEAIFGSSQGIDILSNGFKVRLGGAPINITGNTMIFAAFAENPFTVARAR
jgi:hypothetical protein